MKFNQKNKEIGSIKWIILIVIGFVVASYFFDFDIQNAVEHEQTQSNYEYIKFHVINFYTTFLMEPLNFFWNEIMINIVWENISESILKSQT